MNDTSDRIIQSSQPEDHKGEHKGWYGIWAAIILAVLFVKFMIFLRLGLATIGTLSIAFWLVVLWLVAAFVTGADNWGMSQVVSCWKDIIFFQHVKTMYCVLMLIGIILWAIGKYADGRGHA